MLRGDSAKITKNKSSTNKTLLLSTQDRQNVAYLEDTYLLITYLVCIVINYTRLYLQTFLEGHRLRSSVCKVVYVYEDIFDRLKLSQDIHSRIQQRRLRYFGHVSRMGQDRYPKLALEFGKVCTRPARTRMTKEKMARCSQERLC